MFLHVGLAYVKTFKEITFMKERKKTEKEGRLDKKTESKVG